MAREVATTPDDILIRVVDRLIKKVPECTDSNTYISTLAEDEPEANTSDWMIEVWPVHNYSFDAGQFTGAGNNALGTQMQIGVTLHSTAQNDEVGRDHHYLTNRHRGVFPFLTKILNALSDHDLEDKDGNQLLSEPLRPATGAIPPRDNRTRGYVTLFFDCVFDWHMPTPDPPAPDEEDD